MKMKRLEALLPIVGVAGLLSRSGLLTTWRQWVDPVLLPSPILTFKAMWAGMHGALGFDFVKTCIAPRPPPSSPR